MTLAARSRVRADDRLVEQALVASREDAARLILAGLVSAAGERIDKAGQMVAHDSDLVVRDRARFVSRGGTKLEAALERFGVDCHGVVALDAGCSTGGFTHCLLQRGAARVYAIDVGYGQFAWKLRGDARVVLMERTNIRAVARGTLDPRPSLVVADLSFVSLRSVLGVLLDLAAPVATFVLLVKPQFEVAAGHLERGVVVSADARARVLADIEADVSGRGLVILGALESPIRGADGNVEFLLAARREGER
ncbi:MAG: TlyA family RNA methyltransferase [Deltaproteobacteria bacterium]|nr:TlyA family RNA methyltransferase [Deltaproteobacteria bacterium]